MADRSPLHWRAVCLALALCVVGGVASAEVNMQDDRGQSWTQTATPQRIVSLLPAITEMVCELGGCDRLVGVDRHSNFPAQVQSLPRLGGMDDTPLEALLKLKPDLVLVAGSNRLIPRMQSLGLRVLVFEPRDQADTERMGLALSQVLGGGEARWRLHQERQTQAWDELASQLEARWRGARVYIEVGEGPYVASESSFIGQALKRVGLRSAVAGTWGAFPRLSPEWVMREQPDWVVLAQSALPASRRPGWPQLKAQRQGQVCVLEPAQMDPLVRPGPRLSEGIAAILSCMQAHRAPSSHP